MKNNQSQKQWFWFGVKGAERVWQPWDENKTRRWLKKHPECIAPAGSWRKVETGYYLSRVLETSSELKTIAEIFQNGGRKVNLRDVFSIMEFNVRLGDTPGAIQTLIGIYKECPTTLREAKVPDKDKNVLMLMSYLAGCESPPLPTTVGNSLGWFVAAPDEVTAAAWELALMFVHNIRRMYLCSKCGKVFRDTRVLHGKRGPLRLCPTCKAVKPKRVRRPTERSRLLDLLGAHVRRGKITVEQREQVKNMLQAKGLAAAKELHDKILVGAES